MTDARERQAYDRIEAALARIEAAAAGGGPAARMGELVDRHARLREAAGATLARIDGMIAARES